jgi:L-histidine N-alpha-methyltransferase
MNASIIPLSAASRFALIDVLAAAAEFADDVRAGLTASRKTLPPRWFYDELGSSLFDTICFLPEYYVTRAEAEVLSTHRSEIVHAFGSDVRLVELGSGAARKTRILLDVLTARQRDVEYVPVDVDAGMIERSARELLSEYDRLRITGISSDFSTPSRALSTLPPHHGHTVVLFLGSTIGNLDPDAAVAMLSDLRSALRPGDALLLGADLQKDRKVLEAAYDDELGVTAAFNLNLLGRINRELGGEFDLSSFAHEAFYDETLGRIEMHIVSRVAHTVRIGALDLGLSFDEGETIHTENSWKHTDETIAALATASGFELAEVWKDSRQWFADALLVAR